MNVSKLGEIELRYNTLEMLDYAPGGQLYGTMEGTLSGDRLAGTLRLTNLAARRPDNVNLPTLRGVLSTNDGASIWIEIDGLATLRATDNARIFMTRCSFRSSEERYRWVDTIFAVIEGILDQVRVGGRVRATLYLCEATIS